MDRIDSGSQWSDRARVSAGVVPDASGPAMGAWVESVGGGEGDGGCCCCCCSTVPMMPTMSLLLLLLAATVSNDIIFR